MTPVVPLPWQLSWLSLVLSKTKYLPFSTLFSATEGLTRSKDGSHKVLTLFIRLLGVDNTWLRQKQANSANTCLHG